jgi:hypothetical protein
MLAGFEEKLVGVVEKVVPRMHMSLPELET